LSTGAFDINMQKIFLLYKAKFTTVKPFTPTILTSASARMALFGGSEVPSGDGLS
jgi:hypothetical protein